MSKLEVKSRPNNITIVYFLKPNTKSFIEFNDLIYLINVYFKY